MEIFHRIEINEKGGSQPTTIKEKQQTKPTTSSSNIITAAPSDSIGLDFHFRNVTFQLTLQF